MKSLNDVDWKEFCIGALFTVTGTKTTPLKVLTKYGDGKYPYVTTQATSNGIAGFYNFFTEKGNILTVDSAVLGFCSYQKDNFSASDHVEKLIPKYKFNKYIGIFISNIINQNKSFSYGYKASQKRLRKTKIILPTTKEKLPDWLFMEDYIKDKEKEIKFKYTKHIDAQIENLTKFTKIEKEWKEFKITDLFEIIKGNQNNMSSLKEGNMPLVSAKKFDNGYKAFVSPNNKALFPKNCLTLNNDGDGGAGISYYQPAEMLLDSHVTALIPKFKASNKYSLLYISVAITKQRDKFGHGYSLNNARLSVFKFMLPVNKMQEPDYEYMENYMKYLEQQKILKYLEYLKH